MEGNTKEQSTIRVDVAIKERLRKAGEMGDTYNDVITRLLDEGVE